MGNILNKIINNNILFVGVIVVLCIVLFSLVVLIIHSIRENRKINIYEEELEDEDIKKVKNVKKEDIIESPDIDDKEKFKTKEFVKEPEQKTTDVLESISEEEIETRYEEEKEKELEEVLEESPSNEIEQLLSKMEEDSKLEPEDVVANFEKEQEAQSIISYKELVDAVKNRQEEIYEDELESKPLTKVSDFLKNKNDEPDEMVSLEEHNEVVESIDESSTLLDDSSLSKFKKTDVISPVFGIIDGENNKQSNISETIDLTDIDIDNFNFKDKEEKKETVVEEDAAMTYLDEIYRRMAEDLLKNSDELGETASLEELTKNEEFLQSLKDFRKKL